MRPQGSSGADENQQYMDNGLQREYEGLYLMCLALN